MHNVRENVNLKKSVLVSDLDANANKPVAAEFFQKCFDNRLPDLNGSGVALARLFVALIETHQQNDGSIKIPEPLQPYLRTDTIPAA